MRRIGLLAGVGRLPVEFARAASGMGFHVVGIGMLPDVDAELATLVKRYEQIHIAKIDRIIKVLKAEKVTEVTLLGKINKELVYAKKEIPDFRVLKIFAGLKNFSDDTITLALVKEFADEGITVLDQTELLRPLMPLPGQVTKRIPTAEEYRDIEFGLGMAKAIGGLDIGQTVVVKNRAVLAVEAIEGTDACILRGGQLGRGGVTVVKVAKPKQDFRFDVPSVGPDTIRIMIQAGAKVLAVESGKTLLVDIEEMKSLAESHGIAIVSVTEEGLNRVN